MSTQSTLRYLCILAGLAMLGCTSGAGDHGGNVQLLKSATPVGAVWFVGFTDYNFPPGQYPAATRHEESVEISVRQAEGELATVEVFGGELVDTDRIPLEVFGGDPMVGLYYRAPLDDVELPLGRIEPRCPNEVGPLVDAFVQVHLFDSNHQRVLELENSSSVQVRFGNYNTGPGDHALPEGHCTIEGTAEYDVGQPVLCDAIDVRREACDGVDNDCDGLIDDDDWICAPTQVCSGTAGCVSM